MADYNSATPPRHQSVIPLSISLVPEQYHSTGNAMIPPNQQVELMAAFTFTEDPFKIKKQLTKSDVDRSSRLLLQRDWVEEHILPSMDQFDAQLCRTSYGKQFPILDVNDGSFHNLVLKKWKNTYFVFTGDWVPNFVISKGLVAGDQVGIAFFNGCFFFKLLNKAEN